MSDSLFLDKNCSDLEKTIAGIDDFELGVKRNSSLTYSITTPLKSKPEGIVLVIPGFGADSSQEYQQKLRIHIATNYNLAAVSVNYHAIQIRPATGAGVVLEPDDIGVLQNALRRNNLCIKPELGANLEELSKIAVANDRIEAVTASLVPPNGDYQNFGVMQAVDHLLVLADILQNYDNEKLPVIAFGSSHGGYLANLLAKFAPNTIAAVFDNSAYISAPFNYVLGRQTNMHEFNYQEQRYPNIVFKCYSRTLWNLNRNSNNFFSRDRQEIRALYPKEHLERMKKIGNNKTQYRFIHSITDGIAPFHEKKRYAELLKQSGFDVMFKEISSRDVDGQFVKNTDHGMGLSLKRMFDHFFPTIELKETANDFQLGSIVVHEGFLHDYAFKYDRHMVSPSVIQAVC